MRAKMADMAQSQMNQSTVGAAASTNPGAVAQGGQIADQTARLQQALSECEAAKSECQNKCQSEDSQADSDNNPPYNPRGQDGDVRGDAAREMQKSCIAAIDSKTAELKSGLAQLADAAKGTDATKDASSGGGMMPMPMPMPSGGDNSTPTQADVSQEPKGPDCKAADAYNNSDCNDELVQRCSSNMKASGCDNFIARYCNIGATNNGTTDVAITPPTDNIIGTFSTASTAKKGEGMTSDFCNRANAAKYCETSGRSQCLSCQKNVASNGSGFVTSMNSDELKAAQNACPTDPIFLDSQVQAQMNNTPATELKSDFSTQTAGGSDNIGAGGSSFGAGTGGGSFGIADSVGADDLAQGAIAEGDSRARVSGVGTDGGGGGGGGGGSSYGDDSYSRDPSGLMPMNAGAQKAAAAGATLTTDAKDVAKQYGPSIFSLSSSTYKNLCQRGKLNCPR